MSPNDSSEGGKPPVKFLKVGEKIMLYEDENPPPPKKCNPFPLIFEILATIFFFNCPSSVKTGGFFLVLFFGATFLGFIIGGMVNGDI